jgi:hypothetical protein
LTEDHVGIFSKDIKTMEDLMLHGLQDMHYAEQFEDQDATYKKEVLGTNRARVAVEAAVEVGWERYIGLEGRFVGMQDSAPPARSPTSTRNSTSTPRRWCASRTRRWRRLPLYDIGDPDVGRSRPAASAPSGPVNVSR